MHQDTNLGDLTMLVAGTGGLYINNGKQGCKDTASDLFRSRGFDSKM